MLESRRLGGRAQRRGGLVGSTVLHALFLTSLIVTPLLEPQHKELPRFVSIAIVPAQALGVRDPQPARSAPPARPEPKVEAPPTPKPEPPKPEPSPQPTPPSPQPRSREQPTPRTSRSEPAPAASTLQRRQGSPTGSATGTATMGARVGFDNPNFKHSYYVDRMTAMLSSQWVRPSIGGELAALVHFRIHRDGSVSDISIVESSGYSSYDLAAMRAVQQAAPFPPLPQSFSESSLGVTVEFI